MSIASAITAAQGKVANAYTAVSNKGGTLPATQNLSNLPTAISSIPSGGGTAGYIGDNALKNAFNIWSSGIVISGPLNFANVVGIGTDGMNEAFVGSGITSVSMSSLLTVETRGLLAAFSECASLTGTVNLSSLTTIKLGGLSGTFAYCSGLTGINLSSLETVETNGLNDAFEDCTALVSVDLSSLETVGERGLYGAFAGCTSLVSVDFVSLETLDDHALYSLFEECTALEHVYFRALKTTSFGSYTNQLGYMLSDTDTLKTHTLHFPSNLQSTISNLDSYPRFGGTSGYVTLAFDLPATS